MIMATHLPCLVFLFDLNLEPKGLDEPRARTACTPGYPGLIDSAVDTGNTWRIHFDCMHTQNRHTDTYVERKAHNEIYEGSWLNIGQLDFDFRPLVPDLTFLKQSDVIS